MSRSEAIRRLIEHGLATQSAAAGRSIQEARATSIREARIALERALAALARAEAGVSGKAGKRERE
jgi:hypothetical protein